MTTNILIATITAYCACKTCCGPNAKRITANGQRPIQGITVAIPRKYPVNSKVIIAGHLYTGQDRTARAYDGRFDLFYRKHSDAKKFGIKTNQTVTIITK